MKEFYTMYEKTLVHKVPPADGVSGWAESFFEWLFIGGFDLQNYEDYLQKGSRLKDELIILLTKVMPVEAARIAGKEFFSSVSLLYGKLEDDLEALFSTDPAALSKTDVIVSYPGFFAVYVYRISHWLWEYKIPVIPRFLSEYAHSRTGIDIHPAAQIGSCFVIDHGTGVVIGETSIIGNNVKIYQGVTLGAVNVNKDKADKKRHPTVEDDVTIYANATILGGSTIIGKGAVIGGNVWITASVPSYALVYHKSEMIIKETGTPAMAPINFVI